MTHPLRAAILLLVALPLAACGQGPAPPLDMSGPVADWPHYGRNLAGLRWSPLTQITAQNVGHLEKVWEYDNGDISDGSDGHTRTSFNATPVVAGGLLYFCTPYNRVIALDPETGQERWTFDPHQKTTHLHGPYPRVCRGVEYWRDEQAKPGAVCAERIFTGTLDSQLIALDAKTGKPCADFGKQGRVALREGIGKAPPWEYYPTSPPMAVLDVVVVGALVADDERVDAPAGVVRAFDARTGALRWAWDPVPPGWTHRPETPAGEYTAGTANVWAPIAADRARGIVYVPTGNASPDYVASVRKGLDYYSSSVVALDARSGTLIWHFQTVHHDLWDYDVASQPTLFDFHDADGRVIPALIQPTKTGFLFLLNRLNGKPIFPVEERPVPKGTLPGEVYSPTQPFPTHLPLLHPITLTPDDAFGFTFWDRGKCRDLIASLRHDGIFTPPSLKGTIVWPGSAGGPNWGSASLDPKRGILYVNQMRMPLVVKLIPRAEYDALPSHTATYPNDMYPMKGTPYGVIRSPLLSPLGAPCNPPPWGTLTAVDLAAGKILWEVPLGTTRDQAPFPIWWLQGNVGAPNLGGSIATAGGVLFIGATTEKTFRAFDRETGKVLWQTRLPYTANATPVTYRLHKDGRQFVVVAAGGHGWSQPGDALIAWALPKPAP